MSFMSRSDRRIDRPLLLLTAASARPGPLDGSAPGVASGALRRRGFIGNHSDAVGCATPTRSAGSSDAGPVSKITSGR
jgi:hypothetical protein